MAYYVKIRGKAFGPFDDAQIQDLIKKGQVGKNNEISQDRVNWTRAEENETLFPKTAAAQTSAQTSSQNTYSQPQSSATPSGVPGQWYYSIDGSSGFGPVSGTEIVQLIQAGKLRKDSLVWRDGENARAIRTVQPFNDYFQPQYSSNRTSPNYSGSTGYQTSDVSPYSSNQSSVSGSWQYDAWQTYEESARTSYWDVIKKRVNFSGRSRRQEFWWFQMINTIISFSVVLVNVLIMFMIGFSFAGIRDNDFLKNQAGGFAVVMTILLLVINVAFAVYFILLIVPYWAVLVRRLHDTGNSGWWAILALIPYCIGFIFLLPFLIHDSQPGSNKYGPNPKGM
ncbi:MAG: DUF805 domain-containing protein [Planctomycetaceae bacterium]|jgi:uncharacterized membrane protein YhaH (DUF805 family)|nr:DUF805 domain-containing protein [Planctomycetaceae bacterium]